MNEENIYKQRADELAKQSRERHDNADGKLCPFTLSHSSGPSKCRPDCKWYRAEHKNNECLASEWRSISWNTKKTPAAKKSYRDDY